jgi:hypothetical protein
MLFHILGQATQHQPVPIHFLTKANVLFFFKMLWLVVRSFWPVWAFLLACGAIKLAVIRYRCRRRD